MESMSINGLQYDFSYQNGQSIIFSERNGRNLTEDDMHTVQLKMIQSNPIPHLLPLSVEHIDMAAKLHFDITSQQKVIKYFRDNSTTMNDYYQLFLAIVTALEDSSAYMLNQNNFILHTDFVYIGAHTSDVRLAYLPVKEMKRDTTIEEDVKKLLTDLAGEVDGLQANEFKSVLNYMKQSSFSLQGLKKLLLELVSLRSNVNQITSSQGSQQLQDGTGQANDTSTEPQAVAEEVSTTQVTTKQKTKRSLPPLTSRTKVYIWAGALLAIGITWKLYEMNTTQMMLSICIGISVAILAGVFIFMKIWRPGAKKVIVEQPEKPVTEKQKPKPKQAEPKQKSPTKRAQTFDSPVVSPQTVNTKPEMSFQPEAISVQSIPSTEQDTTLLSEENDDTVLLGDDEAALSMDSEIVAIPLLIKQLDDGQEEKIVVSANNFLIGRNAASVNYEEKAIGVSRIHAEIIQIDAASYGIKDLGSKNGSKLNDNVMVPYKIYALNENDKIEIGKANYIFQWSHTQ
ncbi:FHA domain-containing protein [Ornithinibacillus gellani]|uniref:DUF6382 domain-containing protein n=1 Tax=Ornithinibacillus gellani TaxID=2293253 RepID=UPI000F48CD39|nr:DUF6382 domain-containing protein [Ornithinibacillus gellani]TQS74625.1 FHA domain-containing protein [Ornithinibacillus gellani]